MRSEKKKNLFLYLSAVVQMANQVSGARELQMHQKGIRLLKGYINCYYSGGFILSFLKYV